MTIERARRVAAGLAAAAGIGGIPAAVFLSAPFTLTNDGPQALYGAVVHHKFDDGSLAFSHWVVPNEPITARGADAVLDVLLRSLDPAQALVGLNLVVAVVGALGFWALCRALGRPWPLALAGCALAFRGALYVGIAPYALAEALSLAVLAFWWRPGARCATDVAALAMALYLVARVHAIACALLGLALVIEAVGSDPRRAWRVVVAGLPAAAVAWFASGARDNHDGSVRWEPFVERLHTALAWVAPGPSWRGVGVALLACALLLAFPRASRHQKAIWSAGCALVALALALPTTLLGWELGSLRPLWLGMALLLTALPLEELPHASRRALHVAVGAWTCASLVWAHGFHGGLHADEALLLTDLEHPSPAPQLWLTFPPRPSQGIDGVPAFDPTLHLGQLVAARLGGRAFLTQDGSREIHPVLLRPDAYPRSALLPSPAQMWQLARLDGEVRATALKSLLLRATVTVPRLGVVTRASDRDALAALGFRIVLDGRALIAAAPTLCARPVRVEMPGAVVALGLPGVEDPVLELEVQSQTQLSVPCRGIWLRVVEGCPSPVTWGDGTAPLTCGGAPADAAD